jgi:hypothetical protein
LRNDRPSRPELHARFVQLFAAGAEGGRITASPLAALELDEAEKRFGAALPAAYREFLQRYGTVATPALARRLAESPWTGRVVAFHGLQTVDGTLALNSGPWVSTVPAHVSGLAADGGDDVFRYLVAFTTDSALGERLCFARCGVRSDDLPVFLFDHGSDEIVQVSPSFDDLLWWYVRNLGPEAVWDRPTVRVGPDPPLSELAFTSGNDHNPSYTDECSRCNGFGKLFTFRFDQRRGADDDRPCPDCGTTGRVVKHLFNNDTFPIQVTTGHDGWVTCPCCGWRFSTQDKRIWTGYRHRKCGQRLKLREGAES